MSATDGDCGKVTNEELGLKRHSLRLRIIGRFMLGAVLIIALGLGSGFAYISLKMDDTVNGEFALIADLADELVSDEVNILKKDAEYVAQRLAYSPDVNMSLILESELSRPDNSFISLTVLSREGVMAAAGAHPTSSALLNEPYLQGAFAGDTVLSTTRLEDDGILTLHVCSYIDERRALSATVDGLYFQKLLANFRIWETGDVFLVDDTGTLVASNAVERVTERRNYPLLAKEEPKYDSIAKIVDAMVAGEVGVTYFDDMNGRKQIVAYRGVSASSIGWSLAAVAPVDEGPADDINWGMALIALICLACSVVVAYVTSSSIEKPYLEAAVARKAAEEANATKSAFLANTSHEMRTPLNAIIGLTELSLSSDEMNDQVRGNAEKVYAAGITLLGIINDILDLSKMEAGKLEVVPVDYDTPSLINDTVILNIVRIGSKPIDFILDVDETLPSRLFGDDLRVKQILSNLLSNAFKYTERGQVTLGLSHEYDGDDVWITVRVTDTGIGIKPEGLCKLFSDYSQVDMKSNRKIEGTGLGLSLTKRLVELMDGKVSAESEYGKGSTFTARFKQGFVTETGIGPDVARQLRESQYSESKRDRASRLVRANIPYAHVLIVDDVMTNLDVARGLMRPYGMHIDTVTNGRDAIELVRKGEPRYNAIFMDHMMPDMDGVEATRIIRELDSDYAKNVPVIALTANAIAGNEEMFLNSGFQAFISKPIDIMRLDAIINLFVRDKRVEKELALKKAEGTLERRAGEDRRRGHDRRADDDRRSGGERRSMDRWRVEGIDFTVGLSRFGGDIDTYWEVVESFMHNTPGLIDNLDSLIAQERLADYGVVVHGVKGASRAICAEEVGALAEELEHLAKAGELGAVQERHEGFARVTRELIDGLSKASIVHSAQAPCLPQRQAPDPETLRALLGACRAFDIDDADAAMAELRKFRYTNDGGLMQWLEQQMAVAGFKRIMEKLEDMGVDEVLDDRR